MGRDEIHKGDIGTVFECAVKDGTSAVDVSTTIDKLIFFRKSDKVTVLSFSASFVTDGSNGKIKYVSESGDLDTVGIWKLQGKVIFASGVWYSDVKNFTIHGNLT